MLHRRDDFALPAARLAPHSLLAQAAQEAGMGVTLNFEGFAAVAAFGLLAAVVLGAL